MGTGRPTIHIESRKEGKRWSSDRVVSILKRPCTEENQCEHYTKRNQNNISRIIAMGLYQIDLYSYLS